MLIRKKVKNAGLMWLNPKDQGVGQRLNAQGYREPGFMWLLEKEARGVALDIGANIGYCTLTMAKECKTVIAYEPDLRSFNVLVANTKGMSNVHIYSAAVGDNDATVRFSSAKRPNLSRVTSDGEIEVKMCRIDTLYEAGDIDFIKMDIEGGEVGVIRGGRELLKNSMYMKIAMELHPDRYNSDNDMSKELHWLIDDGYKIKYVENAKGKIDKFIEHGLQPYKTFTNTTRALFRDITDNERMISWCTQMPSDGKKIVRSILLVKG
jgi:FkbM family methyltransferase